MTEAEKVHENIQLVQSLSNELASYLYSLSDEIWRFADRYGSGCECWKVADVVAHLVAGAITQSLAITSALKGSPSRPMGYRPLGREQSTEAVVSLRKALDEDLFTEFNVTCKRLNALLMSLGADSYQTPAWQPLGVVSISKVIVRRAAELAIHGWDIRYGLDRSATINLEALPIVISWMHERFRAGFLRRKVDRPAVRYRFRLKGAVAGSYDIVMKPNDCRLQPSDGSEADVTFDCDADTFVLFGTGRLSFARCVRRGRLTFDGDEELASRFGSWFKPQ